MVEKTYGIQIFYEDAFNEIAGEVYAKGLEDNKIEETKMYIRKVKDRKEIIKVNIITIV